MMKLNTAPSVKERWAVIQCWLTSLWRNYFLHKLASPEKTCIYMATMCADSFKLLGTLRWQSISTITIWSSQ